MSGSNPVAPSGSSRAALRHFEALASPHLAALHAFARRRVGSDEADDALQDTLARAWLAFEQLRDPSAIRAWLFRVMRTVIGEGLRKRERRARLVPITRLESQYDEWLAGTTADPNASIQHITSLELRAALETLPEEFALAVELHDMYGFSYREIAEITEAPAGTVTSRIARGRRLLVALLGASTASEGEVSLPRSESSKGKGK